MHRQGTIFIFILGVLGVIFAIALGLLSSSRVAAVSAFETDPQVLARQAAREGLDHAIGTIEREFVSNPGVPTQLTDDWRSHFWSIDTHLVGSLTTDSNDNMDGGEEFTAEDHYENDVHVENLLLEAYCLISPKGQTYNARDGIYQKASYNHPGTARWFEPGVRSVNPGTRSIDPSAQPLSFHLIGQHPIAPSLTNQDPAKQRGENYTAIDQGDWPNLNASDAVPIRYDANFRPTDDPGQVRYRLRYAVAVECLEGHLLNGLPDEYDPSHVVALNGLNELDSLAWQTQASATTSTPVTASDFAKAFEFDRDRGDLYGPLLVNMMQAANMDTVVAELGMRGLGYMRDGDAWGYTLDTRDAGSLKEFQGSVPYGHVEYDYISGSSSDRDGRLDATALAPTRDDAVLAHEMLGPVPSFLAYNRGWDYNSIKHTYHFTPFGKAPKPLRNKTAPTEWDESYVDTPWRVNFPTAVPLSIERMVHGYLPQEFYTGKYEEKTISDFAGQDADGEAIWVNEVTTPLSPAQPFELDWDDHFERMNLAGRAYFYKNGGFNATANLPTDPHLPYPGADTGASMLHADGTTIWREDLGQYVGTSNASLHNNVTTRYAYYERLGINYGATRFNLEPFDSHTVTEDWFIGGKKEVWQPEAGGNDLARGFWFEDSYWLDITAASTQAIAVAQVTWIDHVKWGSSDNGTLKKKTFGRSSRRIDRNDYFIPQAGTGVAETIPALGHPTIPTVLINDPDNHVTRDSNPAADYADQVPSAFDSMVELDRQFLINLGEIPAHFMTGKRPPDLSTVDPTDPAAVTAAIDNDPNFRMPLFTYQDWSNGIRIAQWTRTQLPADMMRPIKRLLAEGEINQHEAEMMELVVNDYRMSLFGASPQYPDFKPIDFSDDGKVRCSAYERGYMNVNPVSGLPPDPVGSYDVSTGQFLGLTVTDPVDGVECIYKPFSVSGYFYFTKSRYYRIFVRGEVFDTLHNQPAAQSNLEAVYVVDPDGDMADLNMQPKSTPTTGMSDSHVLFQRYHTNAYRGFQSHADR